MIDSNLFLVVMVLYGADAFCRQLWRGGGGMHLSECLSHTVHGHLDLRVVKLLLVVRVGQVRVAPTFWPVPRKPL